MTGYIMAGILAVVAFLCVSDLIRSLGPSEAPKQRVQTPKQAVQARRTHVVLSLGDDGETPCPRRQGIPSPDNIRGARDARGDFSAIGAQHTAD